MPETITSLIEMLEGAEVGSVALNAEICWTLERNWANRIYWRGAMGLPRDLPDEFSRLPRGLGIASLEAGSPAYTTSLDAALALAERLGHDVFGMMADVIERLERDGWSGFPAPGLQSALARYFCAAILRAQSEARV